MNRKRTGPSTLLALLSTVMLAAHASGAEPQVADLKPEIVKFDPFTWAGKIPEGCPFERSKVFNAVRFLGVKSGFQYGDTWYPAWAENDILYSPWTDGKTKRLDGYTDWSQSWVDPVHITTGQGVIIGDDPLTIVAYSIGLDKSSPAKPYAGRYPCGSLIHNGVWYYGTYCLGPSDGVNYGKTRLNWPWIGPFVGFRCSTNYGHSWTPPPHTPEKPIFGESGMWGQPVKIGAPHFVDFGKNMQHSPDGKAYLVAHGADLVTTTNNWRMWNDSWITGDQVYLLRVTPGIKTINDPAAYEFYGGKDKDGKPVWTKDFEKIKPLLEWDNNMGCVTVTYNPVLKKYIMCVTDGGNTVSRMNTYLLEADRLDGDWKIITYMKDFGTQAYFVNIPSKFISADGVTMWLLYSGGFSLDENQKPHPDNPPGGHYGITLQKIELLRNEYSGAVRGSESLNNNDDKPFLHPLFADHAVLQRDARVPVWGWAEPGAKITVSFSKQKKTSTAGPDGKWMLHLDPMPANTNAQTMTVTSSIGVRHSEINNIVVGDVWICSGQSNMEMGMGQCGVSNEISMAEFPLVRLLMVPKKISYSPESTLQCAWLPCSPTTLLQGGWGGFSAAGYFFGRELHRELKVPIGLIEAAWGGTVCEAWTSREALAPLGDFKSGLEQVEKVASSPGPDKLGTAMDKWYQAKDPGTAKEWFKPDTDVSSWKAANMPANWNACGLPGYEGVVWAQRTIELPAGWAGKDLVLGFGTIGDVDTTWVNGVVVGRTDYYDQPRTYKVPGALMKTGRNVIAVRVVNTGGGGFLGKPAEMKICPTGDESSAISLAGPWRVQDTATSASTGPALVGNPNICTVLYNGIIAPLIPFAVKGAVWYQGESNAGRARQYRTLLPAMIKDWRSRFGVGDFGFHIVSLANYKQVSAEPRDNDWAELREAQAMTAKALPNCGIAMAIDIGDASDIHPRNKQEVGRRLALSALAITYGKKIEWSGPWYKSMKITDKGIRLIFDHAKNGLVSRGDKLAGFAIAGEDRNFVWADAVIDGNTVLVSSPSVAKPVAVRYGWDQNPLCNLYNRENLPAVPFRTDNWGVTRPLKGE